MAAAITSVQVRIKNLRQFHNEHFPGQQIPTVTPAAVDGIGPHDECPEQQHDELGYYDDGVKRTLTDDQIAIFRNSEIQRILAERRRAEDQELDTQPDVEEREEASCGEMLTRSNPSFKEHRRRVFEDQAVADAVTSLVYDDDEEEPEQNKPNAKGFIWPKLAQ